MAISTDSTLLLLERAQQGDAIALDILVQRYLPRLRRWASGRLPRAARDLMDTDDVVQETMVKTVRNLGHIEIRDEGALQAYLRQALTNRFADAYRRARHQPDETGLPSQEADRQASPLEQAIGRETLERYDAALQRLSPRDRTAIVLRVELCYEYREIASMLEQTTPAAARVVVSRALARLAREMHRG